MAPLLHNDQSKNNALTVDSNPFPLDWDTFFCLSLNSPSESASTFDQNDAPTRPATGDASHQPSENPEAMMPGNFHDGGMSGDTNSFTLGDLPSCHDIGDRKSTPKHPFVAPPGFLQERANVSPSSPPPSNCTEAKLRLVGKNANDSKEDVELHDALQKGEGNDSTYEALSLGSRVVDTSSLELDNDAASGEHPSIEEWVRGNRPILQDYADRQVSLPLGERLGVSITEPSQSILAALKLLVSRDQEGYVEPSRRIGPQLIENFAEIDRWAKEYLQSRHHMRVVDSEITTLLTVVINNFYEAQVQLIDGLVTRALGNMRTGGRNNLSLGDFAVGFDFQMSQDLPFYVGNTLSKFREPRPIRALNAEPTSEPVKTSSGRQVKPAQRAQQASDTTGDGRRSKENEAPPIEDQQVARTTKSSSIGKHSVTETPEDVTKLPPLNTAAVHLKYRPTVPSNLGQAPILPFSQMTAITAVHSDDNPKSAPSGSTSADGPSNTFSGSNTALELLPRLTIRLPGLNMPAPIISTTSDPGPTLTKCNQLTENAPETSPRRQHGSGARRSSPRGPRNGGRGRGNEDVIVTPNTEPQIQPPEATPGPDNAHSTLPAAHPVGAATHAAIFNASEVFRNFFSSLTGTAAGPGPREAGNSTDTRDKNASMSQSAHTGRSLALPADPGYPQGKKRKLDDCEN